MRKTLDNSLTGNHTEWEVRSPGCFYLTCCTSLWEVVRDHGVLAGCSPWDPEDSHRTGRVNNSDCRERGDTIQRDRLIQVKQLLSEVTGNKFSS